MQKLPGETNRDCALTLKSVAVMHRLDIHQKFNPARNESLSITLPALVIKAALRFMLYTQKLTAQVFVTFLERLIAKRTRKLMWIVDRHPVHRARAVQQWLHQHQDKIEMHFLASYSPQLNPAEYLNCDVKQGVHSKPPTRNLAQLKERLRSHLHKLQKLPARIIKYFKHPSIAYAA